MPSPYRQYHTQIPDRDFEADYQFFMAEDPALGPDAGTPAGPDGTIRGGVRDGFQQGGTLGVLAGGVGAALGQAVGNLEARFGGGRGPAVPLTPDQARQAPLQRLVRFAAAEGFTVTATTGGRHNANSLHYHGRAIDVRVRDKTEGQIAAMVGRAHAAGFGVRDERAHPAGQAVWSGAHIHLEDRR